MLGGCPLLVPILLPISELRCWPISFLLSILISPYVSEYITDVCDYLFILDRSILIQLDVTVAGLRHLGRDLHAQHGGLVPGQAGVPIGAGLVVGALCLRDMFCAEMAALGFALIFGERQHFRFEPDAHRRRCAGRWTLKSRLCVVRGHQLVMPWIERPLRRVERLSVALALERDTTFLRASDGGNFFEGGLAVDRWSAVAGREFRCHVLVSFCCFGRRRQRCVKFHF